MKIKRILVSQPAPADIAKSPYKDIVEKYNIKIDFKKFIKIEGVSSLEFRQINKINILEHTAIIFTSRNAVDHFFRICKELRTEMPDTMKYFCVTEAVALYLQKYIQYRKRKVFHSKLTMFEDLMDLILKHREEKFLVPCSDVNTQEINKVLEKHEIDYTKAIFYKTVSENMKSVDVTKYDMLVFFSPLGIKSLFENFPDFKQNDIAIGAFGAATHAAVTQYGLDLNVPAPTKSAPSMTMAIEEYIVQQLKNTKK